MTPTMVCVCESISDDPGRKVRSPESRYRQHHEWMNGYVVSVTLAKESLEFVKEVKEAIERSQLLEPDDPHGNQVKHPSPKVLMSVDC